MRTRRERVFITFLGTYVDSTFKKTGSYRSGKSMTFWTPPFAVAKPMSCKCLQFRRARRLVSYSFEIIFGLSYQSYIDSSSWGRAWHAAEIFRGYFCRVGYRNASVQITATVATSVPSECDACYNNYDNVKSQIDTYECRLRGENSRTPDSRYPLENAWPLKTRRVPNVRFQKNSHFSLPLHTKHTHAPTNARTHVLLSRGRAESIVTSRRRRSSEQVVQVYQPTIRHARTPTADWLLAVAWPWWLFLLSRLRASSGAVYSSHSSLMHYPSETWDHTLFLLAWNSYKSRFRESIHNNCSLPLADYAKNVLKAQLKISCKITFKPLTS